MKTFFSWSLLILAIGLAICAGFITVYKEQFASGFFYSVLAVVMLLLSEYVSDEGDGV